MQTTDAGLLVATDEVVTWSTKVIASPGSFLILRQSPLRERHDLYGANGENLPK